jgi:4-hydroxybenzoate polyprenyltransferase
MRQIFAANVQALHIIGSLFRITRFWNLVIIAVAQYFTVFFLVSPSYILDWRLALLSVSTLMIAAAGYIINDYYDVKIDLINKPQRVVIGRGIPRRYALLLHTLLSVAGVGLGFILKWQISVINFFSAFLLWWYSNSLKRQPFVGNLSIAFLTALSIFVIPFLYWEANVIYILIYGMFAFQATLLREIIKDIEDLKGDNTFGCRTLPIVWGIRRTKNVIYLLATAFLGLVLAIHYNVQPLPMDYFAIFLFAPLTLLVVLTIRADTKKDFGRLSWVCKVIMLLGVFSMALI